MARGTIFQNLSKLYELQSRRAIQRKSLVALHDSFVSHCKTSTDSTKQNISNTKQNSSNNNTDTKLSRTQMRDQAIQRFKNSTSALGQSQSWEELWKDGLTAWDIGRPTPALTSELLANFQVPEAIDMRVLVPGCGAGYDVIALVKYLDRLIDEKRIKSATVAGLDFAPTSLEQATRILKDFHREEQPHHRTRIELLLGDFFDSTTWETQCVFDHQDTQQEESLPRPSNHDLSFHLIFDYCFFCALPPELRGSWGQRMSQLLEPKKGQLLTLMFPLLDKADPQRGPPFPVSIQEYKKVLERHGLVITTGPIENIDTLKSRQGMELACWWRVGNDS